MICGLRERQQVVVAFQVVREVLKRSPRYSASASAVALDHRAHRAVEDEDALLQRVVEGLDAGGACGDRLVHVSFRASVRLSVRHPGEGRGPR